MRQFGRLVVIRIVAALVLSGVTLSQAVTQYTGHSRERSTGADPTRPELARGAYEAVLRHVYRSNMPQRPRVGIVSLIPPAFDDQDWPKTLASVPPSIRQMARAAVRPVTIRQESLPPGARLISTMNEPAIPYTSVSRVLATDDALGALVVLEHVCGNLCGELTVLWLTRSDTGSAWIVKALHSFWVS